MLEWLLGILILVGLVLAVADAVLTWTLWRLRRSVECLCNHIGSEEHRP